MMTASFRPVLPFPTVSSPCCAGFLRASHQDPLRLALAASHPIAAVPTHAPTPNSLALWQFVRRNKVPLQPAASACQMPQNGRCPVLGTDQQVEQLQTSVGTLPVRPEQSEHRPGLPAAAAYQWRPPDSLRPPVAFSAA